MVAEELSRILKKFEIVALNKMQLDVLDKFQLDQDIVLIAPTGSGKTLAYLLPVMLEMLNSKSFGIVIAPSRELVLQIENVARTMAMGFKITACYGGHSMRTETASLQAGCELLVGTPGRIADHLRRHNVNGSIFSYCVLDEFDKSLEIGFHNEMEEIIGNLTALKKVILTSATEAVSIPEFVSLNQAIKIFDQSEQLRSKLIQWKVVSPIKDKLITLKELILDLLPTSMIVFCNFKESVERVSNYLSEELIVNDFFHGGLDQLQREIVLSKFRNGSITILIATDLAARGLDIPIVGNVIHYHLPVSEEEFIHRNGRTARMGANGNSFILLFEEEDLPSYIKSIPDTYFPNNLKVVENHQQWTTIKLNKGKLDKVNKSDVMGFICKSFDLQKNEVGKIEIKDKISLVAVDKEKSKHILKHKNELKLKGKSVRLEVI